MADFKVRQIPLKGKLITAADPIVIGDNYRTLTNLRYGDMGLEGVKGHTKINSTALASTGYCVARSAHHFKKVQPAETHVLAQAYNSGLTASKVIQNTTAVSATGNFSSTALWTDSSGASIGRFADAPGGAVVYANGVDTCVWGGSEFRTAAFILYDPDDNSYKWDYTEQVTNTSTSEYATIVKYGSADDSNTQILLHLENNVTNSGGATGAVTNSNVTYSTTEKFGTYAGSWNGTTSYISVADTADLDFSDGIFTFDWWMRGPEADGTIFYQEMSADGDTNYFRIRWDYDSTIVLYGAYGRIVLEAYNSTGPSNQALTSGYTLLPLSSYTHIAVVGDGTNYYIFSGGSLIGSAAITQAPENYDEPLYIGCDENGGSAPQNPIAACLMDEIRVSDVARWTSNFTPPSEAYSNVSVAEVYVGSILPIQGVKFYVGTANNTDGAVTAYYWDGSTWTSVSNLSDGTSAHSETLAQTGSITFDSTASTAKLKAIDNMVLYWYKFRFASIDDTTTIYYATVDIPFQTMKDLWDGNLRTPLAFMRYDSAGARFRDYTVQVFEDTYDSADEGTYANLSGTGWVLASDYLLVGSAERLQGISANMVGGGENTTDASMAVSYWDGNGWNNIGSVTDNTLSDNASLGKSGFITWNPTTYGTEFKRMDLSFRRQSPLPIRESVPWHDALKVKILEIGERFKNPTGSATRENVQKHPFENAQFDYPIYWYKLTFNANLVANTKMFYLGCIPAPASMEGYSFPVYYQDCVWFGDNKKRHRNQLIKALDGTVNSFNGQGSRIFNIGDEKEIVGACPVKFVTRDNMAGEALVVLKQTQTWMLYGSGDEYRAVMVDANRGCAAPKTIQSAYLDTEDGVVSAVIYQGSNGIHACVNGRVIDIDADIKNLFTDGTVLSTRITTSDSFYDPARREYHWLWTSTGTTHTSEYVFSCEKLKWFTIDRGTGAYVQCGCVAEDTSGNSYVYGFIDTGHALRLENGTTFAKTASGNAIAHTFTFGDLALAGEDGGDISTETQLRNIAIVGVGKTTTSNTISITHYGDGSTTASTPSVVAMDPGATGYRIQHLNRSVNFGPHVFHGLSFSLTTNDETVGFEPLAVSLLYETARQKVR